MAPKMVVPPGKTFFEELKHTFDSVTIGPAPDQLIPTESFLDAVESFTRLFHVAEGFAFSTVEKDMVGNIAKIRERFLASPLESQTLQDMVKNELAAGLKKATDALFWLTRALEFTSTSIKNALENPTKELTNAFTDMYQTTLRPYHGMIARTAFSAGLKTVPYRKDFFEKLGDDQEKVNRQATDWLGGVDKVLVVLKPFIDSKKAAIGIKG